MPLLILGCTAPMAMGSGSEDLPPDAGAVQTQSPNCTEHPNIPYRLRWQAQGQSFFSGFTFMQSDGNHGATDYVNGWQAFSQKIVEAHDSHAILRAGPRSWRALKRQSAKIATRDSWTYFLTAVRFTHVPFGCGVWPAFWTFSPHRRWPEGGELDILEYANDFPAKTSFHTGKGNRCQLQTEAVNWKGCRSMPDLNNMQYDCTTQYPHQLGCSPNYVPLRPGAEWAQQPGVIAAEWTPAFVKVFFIPEGEIPEDLQADDPHPDNWDRWLTAYYPFNISESLRPGSCPRPDKVMSPQQLIFNIGFCGDWAGKTWSESGSCVNRFGPKHPEECRAIDPFMDNHPEADCCTQFVWDGDGKYGADEHLSQAYFNFSWVKVYQWAGSFRRPRRLSKESRDAEQPTPPMPGLERTRAWRDKRDAHFV